MSGGFFRGTSADQDTRFSNKNAKLLKTQKFPPELDELVDFSKVKLDVIKPWIAKRVTEILGGVEDDVLINLIYALLEEKKDGKEIQIQITGFLEKNTSKFMKELWSLLLSAQKNMSGVPQQFIDEKAEETRKKKEFDDRITLEVQRLRQVHEQEQAATAEHNRKLTADVEAAKKAAAEAAARLSAQLLEQQDHKNSGPPAQVSADRVAVVDELGEKKQQDEPKPRSSRSPNPSDKSRSPERRTSRSPPRRARRSPLAPPRHAQSRSPPPRRRMSRSASPSRKAPSRSRSRSRSRDSPYKSPPPRYRQSRRSPPYDMDRRGGGYYNGRSGSAYSGRRDKERDWHRRPGDRPYDNRAANERHYGRRMDPRDSYAERSMVRRGPERIDRRPPYDNRRPAYEDRHVERGHVGGKRPYREVEERRPVSPFGTRRSLSPPDGRGGRAGSGEMEQDSEEDVKPALARERQVGKQTDADDRGEKPAVVVRRDIGGRRGAEAMREEDDKVYPTYLPGRIDTALKEVGGRKEVAAAPVVGSSEEEMEHERSQRRDSRQEVSGLRRDLKVADEGDASPEDSEERRELKRRKKEEKRARKEERRKKREEKRQRKEEKRAAKEAKNRLQSEMTDGQGRSNGQEEDDRNSEDGDLVPVESQKQLEEDLRKKALESLRAKKIGVA